MRRYNLWKFFGMMAAAIALCAEVPANWGLGHFVRPDGVNPVIGPRVDSVFACPMRKTQIHWEALHAFNPAAVVRNGKVYVIYRAEDNTGEMQIGMHTSRLGLAESDDGLHFTRRASPVLYPADDAEKGREWEGGCEDPRVVESPDGTYVLTYTQWNRKITDIGIATSKDLVTWTKHGPAFARASGGKYLRTYHKSAGIVSQISGDRLIAAKIDGKYWMYWGEGEIRLATSSDLIDWRPVEDARGEPDRRVEQTRGPLRQQLSGGGTSAGADARGHRGALQRQECGQGRGSEAGRRDLCGG